MRNRPATLDRIRAWKPGNAAGKRLRSVLLAAANVDLDGWEKYGARLNSALEAFKLAGGKVSYKAGKVVASLLLIAMAACGDWNPKVCATGERLILEGDNPRCVCVDGAVRDEDGVGCHISEPPPPTPSPTPAPTPTPSATPTPAPTPTPVPTPTPRCSTLPECGGPEGPRHVYGCCRMVETFPERSEFQADVDAVLREIEAAQPRGIVSGNNVLSEELFTAAVAERLRARGFCATPGGPGDEVGVKGGDGRSEQFDVVFANGKIRYEGFVAVCRPARF